MKNMKPVVMLVVLGAIATGSWWFMSRKTALASPAALVAASPIPLKESFTVEARHAMTYTLTAPAGKTPGWMTGRWTSKGKSAGLRGATDDSLIAFKIIGPDGKEVEKLDRHPVFGNFKLRFDGPGSYTLVFDNGGIIRSSARVVELDGAYQPD